MARRMEVEGVSGEVEKMLHMAPQMPTGDPERSDVEGMLLPDAHSSSDDEKGIQLPGYATAFGNNRQTSSGSRIPMAKVILSPLMAKSSGYTKDRSLSIFPKYTTKQKTLETPI